jgi:hypothetical protein
MLVLIAGEESQTICKAFRARGHEAFSCDLATPSGGRYGWHLQLDIFTAINAMPFELMIAHPDCTHLAVSGAKWFKAKRLDGRQAEAIDNFLMFTRIPIAKKCIENPVSIMSKIYRKPDQIVNPYDFGDPARKKTCLWLENLPKLRATTFDAPLFGLSIDKGEVEKYGKSNRMAKWLNLPPGPERAKIRSRTFEGMANAMATQWG